MNVDVCFGECLGGCVWGDSCVCDCVWVKSVCSGGDSCVCVFRECVWGEGSVANVCVCLRIKDDYFN